MWGTLFTAFSGTGLLEFVSLMEWLGLLHGHVGVDFSCGFLVRIFCVRIWGADFFFADFGVRIFRGFCDGLCGLWVRIFWAVFPQKKP